MKQSGWYGFANGVYWLLLGLWLGSLVLSAATAAFIFPMMIKVEPTLPEYSAYAGSHGLLLAGQVMSQVFTIQDFIELIAIVGVVVIMVGHFVAFGHSIRTRANAIRIAAIAVLMIIVSYKAFIVSPRMFFNLRDYWVAAKAGEMDKADAAKGAFDADHPTARLLMEFTLAGLVVLVFSSAAALSSPVVIDRQAASPAAGGPRLEEPELLKRMNA